MPRPKNQIPTKLFARRLNADQIQTVTEALEKWGSGSITARELEENERRYLCPKPPTGYPFSDALPLPDAGLIEARRLELESLKTHIKALLADVQVETERNQDLMAELDKVRRDVSGNEKAAYWASEATRFKRRVMELESQLG